MERLFFPANCFPSLSIVTAPLEVRSGWDIVSFCCTTWQRPYRSITMDERLPALQLLASSLSLLAIGRYTLACEYTVCFYDWAISLEEEVAFVFSAPWNTVKAAYLFSRYYPLAVAPFHFWGFLGDHEQHVCESYYHALSLCTIPTIFSAQFILMLRTYAFSGRKKKILAILSTILFGLTGFMIWVSCKQLILSPLFLAVERSACFGISDPPSINVVQAASEILGISVVQVPFSYHLGLIFVLSALFDGFNLFVMLWHCYRDRHTLGSLAQSILKQGIFLYIVMTVLNTLTIGTFFSSQILHEAKAIGPWFAYVLPSPLSCRLVLMLRRKASPTETQLRNQYSHVVNEALEMLAVESHLGETLEDTTLSVSNDAHAQP
ncbi:hypothetical protein H4582DRAFT_2103944 [Lactarius indigo]|nr:hypothetical protein H4582DRAFT_2103944 [Lactarius indigo]